MSGAGGRPGTAPPPVSVFLITRDEAVRLPATLAALAWADEIVVVDSGSDDETCTIARAAGARVEHRDWEGYGQQKRFAEGLCRNDWMLNIDADEVVTPALADEIADLFAALHPPEPCAYRVKIRNVYPGDTHPRRGMADYDVVRFYHRTAGGYREHPLFDRVEPAEGVEIRTLRADIHHHPLISWAHFVEKENRYSSFAASHAAPRGRGVLLLRLIFEFPVSFVKFYVLRQHILGGWKGLAFATVAAFGRTLRIIKMLERADTRRPNDHATGQK